jgi:hypothetical protein
MDRKIKNLQKKVSALKRSANQEAEDESDDEDPNTSAGAYRYAIMPVWRAVIGRILRRGPKKRKNV